jgi:hypothetical protein
MFNLKFKKMSLETEQTERPRSILSRLIKEEIIASNSTAHNAKEREETASKAIEKLLGEHPGLVDKVDQIQENHIKNLR